MRRISTSARRRQRQHARQLNHIQRPQNSFSGSISSSSSISSSNSCDNNSEKLSSVRRATTTTTRRTVMIHRALAGTTSVYPLTASLAGNSNGNGNNKQQFLSTSAVASVSCWLKDVLRTKKLSPPNPILESLPSNSQVAEALEQPNPKSLPKFSVLRPHHLEKAGEEISRQHDVELAQLEVRWTSFQTEDDDDDNNVNNNSNVGSLQPSSLVSLLLDLDKLTAPVVQLREVSELYETLASTPDQIRDWIEASESVDSRKTKNFIENLYRSRIIYRALASAVAEESSSSAVEDGSDTGSYSGSTTTTTTMPSFLVPFLKRGAHIDINQSDAEGGNPKLEEQAEHLRQIEEELSVLNDRLDNVVSYDRASKAMRLQCMSDMYNCIGLSRLQAESLLGGSNNTNNSDNNNTESDTGNDNVTRSDSVWRLARLQHRHMVESPTGDLTESLFPEIAGFLQPFLPQTAKLDLEGVGAFLEGKSEISGASSIDKAARASLKARYDFKQRMRLHGVLKGFIDFCDQILGLRITEDTEANNAEAGWSKNVRLLHLYEKAGDNESNNDDNNDNDNTNGYLGTIYFDPFADSYWRTEDAKNLVKTRLFSQQVTGQTTAPVAVVALKITPIWDDTPVPMTWRDTRDLLQELGSAIQQILDQSRRQRNYSLAGGRQSQSQTQTQTQNGPGRKRGRTDTASIEAAPIDTSQFLGHFLEMWLQNDGFLHRLAQLSQDELVLDDETLKALRKDTRKEKALELTNTMFLSALQFSVFETFDPRGDETLVALQERLAKQYLPASNLPDPSDLSPLLAVFQQSGLDQKMSAYGTLWSEVMAATVYETFQKTDLRDREEVERLGKGIRDLFLRDGPLERKDIADLCKIQDGDGASIGSGAPLKRVYGFEDAETTNDDSTDGAI